jgi:hypothetical protein
MAGTARPSGPAVLVRIALCAPTAPLQCLPAGSQLKCGANTCRQDVALGRGTRIARPIPPIRLRHAGDRTERSCAGSYSRKVAVLSKKLRKCTIVERSLRKMTA